MERFKKILLIALSAAVLASVGNVSAMKRKRSSSSREKFDRREDGKWIHGKGPHKGKLVRPETCRRHGLDCGEKIRKTGEDNRPVQPTMSPNPVQQLQPVAPVQLEIPEQPDLGQTEQPLLQGWANKVMRVDVNGPANFNYGLALLRMLNGMSTRYLKMVEVYDDGGYVIEKDLSCVETDDEFENEYGKLESELECNQEELADIKRQIGKITPEILKQIRRDMDPTFKNKVLNVLNRLIENKARSLRWGILSASSLGYAVLSLVPDIISDLMADPLVIIPLATQVVRVGAAILLIFGSWSAYKAHVAVKLTSAACKLEIINDQLATKTNNNQPVTNNNQPATNNNSYNWSKRLRNVPPVSYTQ